MATIKLKYRPSAVSGRGGSLFFQVTHRRQVRQISTGLRVGEEDWDAAARSIVRVNDAGSERAVRLSGVKAALREQYNGLLAAISCLERRGAAYTAGDVMEAFFAPRPPEGLVTFARGLIGELRKIGKKLPPSAMARH